MIRVFGLRTAGLVALARLTTRLAGRVPPCGDLSSQGETTHCKLDFKRLAAISHRQAPFAVIVGCADSRVIPELAFDQGLGRLFVVRVAGNTCSPFVLASIQYAVERLGVKLVLVLGHTRCGAVTGAVDQFRKDYQGGGGSLRGASQAYQRVLQERKSMSMAAGRASGTNPSLSESRSQGDLARLDAPEKSGGRPKSHRRLQSLDNMFAGVIKSPPPSGRSSRTNLHVRNASYAAEGGSDPHVHFERRSMGSRALDADAITVDLQTQGRPSPSLPCLALSSRPARPGLLQGCPPCMHRTGRPRLLGWSPHRQLRLTRPATSSSRVCPPTRHSPPPFAAPRRPMCCPGPRKRTRAGHCWCRRWGPGSPPTSAARCRAGRARGGGPRAPASAPAPLPAGPRPRSRICSSPSPLVLRSLPRQRRVRPMTRTSWTAWSR